MVRVRIGNPAQSKAYSTAGGTIEDQRVFPLPDPNLARQTSRASGPPHPATHGAVAHGGGGGSAHGGGSGRGTATPSDGLTPEEARQRAVRGWVTRKGGSSVTKPTGKGKGKGGSGGGGGGGSGGGSGGGGGGAASKQQARNQVLAAFKGVDGVTGANIPKGLVPDPGIAKYLSAGGGDMAMPTDPNDPGQKAQALAHQLLNESLATVPPGVKTNVLSAAKAAGPNNNDVSFGVAAALAQAAKAGQPASVAYSNAYQVASIVANAQAPRLTADLDKITKSTGDAATKLALAKAFGSDGDDPVVRHAMLYAALTAARSWLSADDTAKAIRTARDNAAQFVSNVNDYRSNKTPLYATAQDRQRAERNTTRDARRAEDQQIRDARHGQDRQAKPDANVVATRKAEDAARAAKRKEEDTPKRLRGVQVKARGPAPGSASAHLRTLHAWEHRRRGVHALPVAAPSHPPAESYEMITSSQAYREAAVAWKHGSGPIQAASERLLHRGFGPTNDQPVGDVGAGQRDMAEARAMLKALNAAPQYNGALQRGGVIGADQVGDFDAKVQKGYEFDMPLAPFSKGAFWPSVFTQSLDPGHGRVIYSIQNPKAIDLADIEAEVVRQTGDENFNEQEAVVGGRFKVASVYKQMTKTQWMTPQGRGMQDTPVYYVSLEQEDTFNPDTVTTVKSIPASAYEPWEFADTMRDGPRHTDETKWGPAAGTRQASERTRRAWVTRRLHSPRTAAQLAERAVSEGGFTYNPKTGKFPTRGIAVAVPGNEHTVSAGKFSADDLAGYLTTDRIKALRDNPKMHLGGWYDTAHDDIVLDFAEVYPEDERDAAVAAGRRRNQQAIFDIGKLEEIPTGGTGEAHTPEGKVMADGTRQAPVPDPPRGGRDRRTVPRARPVLPPRARAGGQRRGANDQAAVGAKTVGLDVRIETKDQPTHHSPNPNARRLREYWTRGEGAAKIGWNTPNDWYRCVRHLKKYVADAKGYCFAGETQLLTRDGVVSFADVVGTRQMVLTPGMAIGGNAEAVRRNGRWVDVDVNSYGEQRLLSVTVSRAGVRKVIRATPEHVWFASRNGRSTRMVETCTTDLVPGMALAALIPQPVSNSRPSPFGVAAGFIFGDGHHVTGQVRWTVESVEDHGDVEEVFCVEVPGTESFALADYIWVHNCAQIHKDATGVWPGDRRNVGGNGRGKSLPCGAPFPRPGDPPSRVTIKVAPGLFFRGTYKDVYSGAPTGAIPSGLTPVQRGRTVGRAKRRIRVRNTPVDKEAKWGPAAGTRQASERTRRGWLKRKRRGPVPNLGDFGKRAAYVDQVTSQGEWAMGGPHDTRTLYMDARGVWSPERRKLHRRIVRQYLEAADHAGVPRDHRALLTGGLPGAGKTTALNNPDVLDTLGVRSGDFLSISSDDIKEAVARMGAVDTIPGLTPIESAPLMHEESSQIADQLLHAAAAKGYNVVWDGTMASESGVMARTAMLQAKGYNVEGLFVDVSPATSIARVKSRYAHGMEQYQRGVGLGGRWVPSNVIAKAGIVPANLSVPGPDGPEQPRSVNRVNFDKALRSGLFTKAVVFSNEDTPTVVQRYP